MIARDGAWYKIRLTVYKNEFHVIPFEQQIMKVIPCQREFCGRTAQMNASTRRYATRILKTQQFEETSKENATRRKLASKHIAQIMEKQNNEQTWKTSNAIRCISVCAWCYGFDFPTRKVERRERQVVALKAVNKHIQTHAPSRVYATTTLWNTENERT